MNPAINNKYQLTVIVIFLSFSLSGCSDSNAVGNCGDDSRNCYKITPEVSRVVAHNIGERPTALPQLVSRDGEDLSSWKSFLAYLEDNISLAGAKYTGNEDYDLLIKLYEYMGKNLVHLCSPGRRGEGIYDLTSLVRDYGYACCSDTSRAFGWIVSNLGFEVRVVSAIRHEFPEVKINGKWQIIDPYTPVFGSGQRFFTLEGIPLNHETLAGSENIVVKTAAGETGVLNAVEGYKGRTLDYVKSVYSEDIIGVHPWNFSPPVRNPVLHPNESIEYEFHKKINGLRVLDDKGQPTPTGGNKAPDVGVVNYRQRVFEKSNNRWNLLPPPPPIHIEKLQLSLIKMLTKTT